MSTDTAARREALDEAVRRAGEAWACGDLAALEALLSPGYTHTDFQGQFLDRAAWLDYVARRTRLGTRIGFADLFVRTFGDVAVVTGRNDIDFIGRSPDEREQMAIRFTQLWIWREDRWLREAFQATVCTGSATDV